MSFLSVLKPTARLNLDHFACMRKLELTEDIGKEHRDNTYTHKKRCKNPIPDATWSSRFVANSCPQQVSMSFEPKHMTLIRSNERYVLKLATSIVRVVRKCEKLAEVRIGLHRIILETSNRASQVHQAGSERFRECSSIAYGGRVGEHGAGVFGSYSNSRPLLADRS
jgi:hypothetical protein